MGHVPSSAPGPDQVWSGLSVCLSVWKKIWSLKLNLFNFHSLVILIRLQIENLESIVFASILILILFIIPSLFSQKPEGLQLR